MESVLPVWLSPAGAAGTVVAAAALAWLRARAILSAPAGPTLPERLQQWRGHHQGLLAIAMGALILSGIQALWAIPAVWLAFQAVGHRVRTQVFGDTWSLAGQVRWNLRALAGVLGFWWAVSLAPFALTALAAPAWASLVAAATLIAWNHFYGEIVLAALGATPLDRPAVLAAFEPVLARAKVPRPRLMRAGPRGASLANAFAMASPQGDVVLFLDGFLDHASPAEVAGVLAHELGHLEEFATRRLQLYSVGVLLAIAGAIVSASTAFGIWPAWSAAVWFLVAMGTLLARALRSQDRERASDARAVELCGGDGEALVRALVTLHALAHVPRRFDPEFERHATHPSLARRVAAIRALGGVPPALIEPRAFPCDGNPSRAVVFDATRFALVTVDGVADLANVAALLQEARQVEAADYTELTELRLAPAHGGGATLIATDRRRHQRRATIAPADLAAVQGMLDLADQRMTATPGPVAELPALGRIAALVAACVALPVFAWSVLAAALLASVRPTAPLLAAVSAGLAVVAALRDRQPSTDWSLLLFTTAAIACGTLAVRHIRAERRADIPFRVDAFLVAGFVVTGMAAAIPAALVVAFGYHDLERLHAAARAFSIAAPALAALGAFCVAVPRRASRIAGAGAFAAMAAAATLASDEFRDVFAPDPLIAEAPPLVVDDVVGTPDASVSETGSYTNVWLAPDAQHVILEATRDGNQPDPDRYVVAALNGWRREIAASEVSFLDAASLFVVRSEPQARILSVEPIRGGAPRWSLRLDDPPAGEIEVDASGRWRLEPSLDPDMSQRDVDRLEGRIGDRAVRRTTIAGSPHTRGTWRERGVSAAGTSIQIARRWNGGMPTGLDGLVPGAGWSTDLERLGGRAPGVLARTRLELDCHGPTLTSDAATCFAKTGDETFVWDVAADAGPPVPTARIAGRVTTLWLDDATALFWRDRDLLLFWRGTNRAIRLPGEQGCPCPHDAAYANRRLATLTTTADRSTVRLYAIAPPGPAITASAAAQD